MHYLDFEKPLQTIANQINDLQSARDENHELPGVKNVDEEIELLEVKLAKRTRMIYRNLEPWQRVQVARHPERPHAKDYINSLIEDFTPLAGDRNFAEDNAMLAGLGYFGGKPVAVLGIEKGTDTASRVKHNFGMPKPEGYRKAKRIMDMADRFNMPLLTFVDTPGAYPGVGAEERGQSEAIATCIEKLLQINVPVVSVITGEGGSGGALAIAVADKVIMLENSVYSVISPEGCASILWKEANKETIPQAAESLRMTAPELEKHNIVDEVIKEPVGGAHRDIELTMVRVQKAILEAFKSLESTTNHKHSRRERFLKLTEVK